MVNATLFQKAVFAGGGHRCWWQAGWWLRVAAEQPLAPTRIAAVSAGAATACLLYANTPEVALEHYRSAILPGARNAYWNRAWQRGQRVFPHEGIYRQALLTLLGGEAFERLKRDAPSMRVLYALAPRGAGAIGGFALGVMAYNIEKHIFRSLHPRLGSRLGFEPVIGTLQACADVQTLIDLLLSSSATPPFTRLQSQGGRGILDGGMIDNVPVMAIDDPGEARDPAVPDTLVLLTRRYERYPEHFVHDGRVYVQPSRRVPVSGWDYTVPAAYEATYRQGRDDGERFLHWLEGQSFQRGTT
ncbi:MAG: patatin-like phospholipase family protein [Burkholderiaceae bacterium]